MRSISCLCAVTFSATIASAAPPDGRARLGSYAGLHLALDDWDLNDPAGVTGESPLVGGALGLRIGVEPLGWLGLEADLGLVLHPSGSGAQNVALRGAADVLVYPFDTSVQPFLKVGAGNYRNVSGDRGTDGDFDLHYGVGVRAMITDAWLVRVDVVHVLTDGYALDDSLANNLFITVGLEAFIEGDDEAPPADSDGDGIMDVVDRCPREPGLQGHAGCPAPREVVPVVASEDVPQAEGVPEPYVAYFALNESDVSQSEGIVVLASYLDTHPQSLLVIEGHTDNLDESGYNQRLSERRAAAVARLVTDHGIAPRRITTRGFGETRPQADNTTASGRAQNRRAEARIAP